MAAPVAAAQAVEMEALALAADQNQESQRAEARAVEAALVADQVLDEVIANIDVPR